MIKKTFLKRMSEKTSTLVLFAREILSRPREIGAACPSSPILGKAMAKALPLPIKGMVIELGAGTGTITAALLARGIPPNKLLILERSPNLVKHLRRKFPQLTIIEGDAALLSSYLPQQTSVMAIVSGLPLRSLPAPLVKDIINQINQLLSGDGVLIQFTYDLRGKWFEQHYRQFRRLQSFIVWRNLPPARVDVFCKR